MRATEILDEAKFKDLLGPLAFAAASVGASQVHGEDPLVKFNRASAAQYAQDQRDEASKDAPYQVTYELPPARSPNSPKTQEPEAAKAAVAPVSKEQATLLALTMWGEARSHGTQGMRAVGHVVLNRMASKRDFGDSIKDVVWKRKAFSCWNPSDPNREAMKKVQSLPKDSKDYQRFVQAKKIAVQLLAHQLRDTTGGALFYHTDGVDPAWAQGIKPVAQVANHSFYRTDHKAQAKREV